MKHKRIVWTCVLAAGVLSIVAYSVLVSRARKPVFYDQSTKTLLKERIDSLCSGRQSLAVVAQQLGDMGEAARPAVPALLAALRRLHSDQACARTCVVEALGSIGDRRAVPELVAFLKKATNLRDHEEDTAVEALRKLKDPRAAKPLLEYALTLWPTQGPAPVDAWQALMAIGPRADPLVIGALARGGLAREYALNMSGLRPNLFKGHVALVKPFIEILKTGSADERTTAARALAGIGDRSAIAPLTAATRDSNENVRYWARWALSSLKLKGINSKKVVAHLSGEDLKQLINRLQDRDFRSAFNAAAVLGREGDSRAIAPLIAALNRTADSFHPLEPPGTSSNYVVITDPRRPLDLDEQHAWQFRHTVAKALSSLTGRNFGILGKEWMGWWKSQQQANSQLALAARWQYSPNNAK